MIFEKSHIEAVMYGRRRSPVLTPFLRIISMLYRAAIGLRSAFYKIGLFKRKKLAQRVISVGNITLGGTGKTPAVMQIAGTLLKHHRRPAIISRGYGRRDETALVVVSNGKQVLTDASTGGDEPVLMACKLSDVPVIVGSNRFEAALFALNKFSSDTIILDDGFQHLRVRRDLDIVLIDSLDPFGTGKLFPAGILREPVGALGRADIVLVTHIDCVPDLDALKKTIRRTTDARIFTSRQAPVDLVNAGSNEAKPLAALRGTSVLAFSGIARPESFHSTLVSLGAEIKSQLIFDDHRQYSKSDLAGIYEKAADNKISMIVTTEKDGVRLRGMNPEAIWALRIELKIVEEKEWEAVLLNR